MHITMLFYGRPNTAKPKSLALLLGERRFFFESLLVSYWWIWVLGCSCIISQVLDATCLDRLGGIWPTTEARKVAKLTALYIEAATTVIVVYWLITMRFSRRSFISAMFLAS